MLIINDFIIKDNISVMEAMSRINANNCGIVFVVDENGALKGCVTDGDIRRYLLSAGNITACVMEAMNSFPVTASSYREAARFYHARNYKSIPVVDNAGKIIDIYCGEEISGVSHTKAALNIPVVINAGGRGTRLDPFTKVLPKPLIPVGERPIIELIMQEYEAYGCIEFNIIVNYKRELIKAYFADEDKTHHVIWYDEIMPLGTGGGLSLLKGKLEETFFFANCDALLTADYERIVNFHKESHNTITMVCALKNLNIPYGIVETGDKGIVLNMKEKPVMPLLTNTGIYVVEPEVLHDIEDNVAIGFPDIIKKEMKKGKRVAAFTVNEEEWMDMGQIPELEKMRAKLCGE